MVLAQELKERLIAFEIQKYVSLNEAVECYNSGNIVKTVFTEFETHKAVWMDTLYDLKNIRCLSIRSGYAANILELMDVSTLSSFSVTYLLKLLSKQKKKLVLQSNGGNGVKWYTPTGEFILSHDNILQIVVDSPVMVRSDITVLSPNT